MISLLLPLVAATADAQPKLDDLAFMAGTWTCEIWGGTFEESWSMPKNGSMQGTGRHMANGKTEFMEFMSIEDNGESITMYMLLGKPSQEVAKPVPFKLTSFDGKTALFENPANDYPTKIAYLKEGKGMSCWIEGPVSGKTKRETFAFKRVP